MTLIASTRQSLERHIEAQGVPTQQSKKIVASFSDLKIIIWLVTHGPELLKIALLVLALFTKENHETPA